MEKIKIKGIILVLLLVLGILGLNTKYQKYRNEKNNEKLLKENSARYAEEDGNDEKNNEKLLKENKKELEAKIENVISEREERRKEIQSDYEQIQIITGKLGLLSMKNESEFKKMIYVFTRESGLKMNEISKAETLWERNGYKLKYIHFTLYGSLNNFGKFLYFLNKSRKFIDTSRMYIDLTGEGFKISLGFIEKGKIAVKN